MIARSAGVAEVGPFREQGNFWRGAVWQHGWFNYFIGSAQIHWPHVALCQAPSWRDNVYESEQGIVGKG
jgi:hypothetical protein